MAMYALFQMLASVLVVIIQRSEKEFGGECQARAEVGSAIFFFVVSLYKPAAGNVFLP